MGILKRAIRALTRHKVKITGDVTFSLGKFKPAPEMLVAGGGTKRTQLSRLLNTQEDTILYFLHVEVDNCFNLGSSDAMGLSDPFVILYLNGVEFGRTSVKDNTCRPVWQGESFEIPVFESLGVPCLTVAVYDMDSDGVGDFLGNCIYNFKVDHLGLKLYEEKDLRISTATMNLDAKKNDFTSHPSMFEPPTVVMHRSQEAKRNMIRSLDGRRGMSSLKIKEAVQDVEDSKDMIIGAFLVIAAYLGLTYWVFSHLLEEKVRKGEGGGWRVRKVEGFSLASSSV